MKSKNNLKVYIILLILISITILICYNKLFYIKKKIYWKDFIEIKNVYTHNKDIFTQGIFFDNNELYETGGLYGKSCLYKDIDIKTGIADKTFEFENSIFAEGSTILDNKLYVLTYKENKAFMFNKETLDLEKEYIYGREGWGLTTDGENLIASDGTSNIFFLDKELNTIKKINVKLNRKGNKKYK